MLAHRAIRTSSHFLGAGSSGNAFVRAATSRVFRPISNTATNLNNDSRRKRTATSADGGSDEHEGRFARTDKDVRVEYPEEHELPSSVPVQGRGGLHFKRTLASFSLEGRVGVVTGGARGLGLVMSEALVVSGADVAIVDLNSKYTRRPCQG